MANIPARPILFFDGICNLCNTSVQFVIKHDKKELFLFAPLQSFSGLEALQAMNQQGSSAESVILFYNGRYYNRSGAALYTLKLLGFPWNLFFSFIIIPRFIRDGAYKIISANRYKWFGQRNICILPTKALKHRFLE